MTPKQIIAGIMDRVVERPGHNMLAHEIVKKLDAEGFAIVPKEPTPEMIGATFCFPVGPRRYEGEVKPENQVVATETSAAIYRKMVAALSAKPL